MTRARARKIYFIPRAENFEIIDLISFMGGSASSSRLGNPFLKCTCCSTLTMERLFSPYARSHNIFESQNRFVGLGGRPEPLQELNLNISIEELLSAERASKYGYADSHAILLGNRNTFAWLIPHAFVASHNERGMVFWLQLHHLRRLNCLSAPTVKT
jgi:hypothetical protein